MTRVSLPFLLFLLPFPACRDGPTAIGMTDRSAWDRAISGPTVVGPLMLVNALMNDGFVRPLTIDAIGRAAADHLAVALEPVSEELAQPDFTRAIRALSEIRLQLAEERPEPQTDLAKVDGSAIPEDPEALIVQDALSLVVDDALQVLLAADSTGGG